MQQAKDLLEKQRERHVADLERLAAKVENANASIAAIDRALAALAEAQPQLPLGDGDGKD